MTCLNKKVFKKVQGMLLAIHNTLAVHCDKQESVYSRHVHLAHKVNGRGVGQTFPGD